METFTVSAGDLPTPSSHTDSSCGQSLNCDAKPFVAAGLFLDAQALESTGGGSYSVESPTVPMGYGTHNANNNNKNYTQQPMHFPPVSSMLLPQRCHYPHGAPGTYYEILNVRRNCTQEEIFASYRLWHESGYKKAKNLCPTRADVLDHLIVDARLVLGHVELREQYDQHLRSVSPPKSPSVMPLPTPTLISGSSEGQQQLHNRSTQSDLSSSSSIGSKPPTPTEGSINNIWSSAAAMEAAW